jgi:hypothetical protein
MAFRTVSLSGVAASLSLAAMLVTSPASMGIETGTAPPPTAQQSTQPQTTQQQPTPKQAIPKPSKRKKAARKKQAEVPPPAPPPEEPLQSIIGVADVPRDYLSGKFVGFVNGVDRFFADERNFQENTDSVFQLDFTRVTGYGGAHQFAMSGRAKVRLPNTEKRLHLLIESDPDKNVSTDPNRRQTVLTGTNTKPQSYGAGVRYEQTKEERWHFSTDGGLKFQGINTTPFARSRLSYGIPLAEWRMKAAETVFWFNTIGAGEMTQLDFERTISEPLLFRATSNATWLHDKQNLDLRQDLSFFHTLNERTALLYQASAIGVSRPQTQVTDYVLLVLCRYRLHRKWMFFELSPQVHFPKAREFKSSGMLSMRLEVLFDESR